MNQRLRFFFILFAIFTILTACQDDPNERPFHPPPPPPVAVKQSLLKNPNPPRNPRPFPISSPGNRWVTLPWTDSPTHPWSSALTSR